MRTYRTVAIMLVAILIVQPLLVALNTPRAAEAAPLRQAATPAPSGRGQIVLPGPFGVNVNTFNGNLYYSRADLDLPGCGAGLELTFAYNSFQAGQPSPFGYGWQFQYSIYYSEDSQTGDVTITWGDGHRERYVHLGNGVYLAPTGSYDTLTRTQAQPEHRYELITSDRLTYFFDAAWHRHVTKLQQPNGRALLFGYDAAGQLATITDAYGRRLGLTYGDGRLTAVTNANVTPARTFQYGYDAAGNLVSVTDPLGQVTGYTYDEAHQLTKITDAAGNSVTIGYGNGQVIGLSTRLATMYLSYDNRDDGSSRTTVMEAVSGQEVKSFYDYDTAGRATAVTDPLGGVTRNSWDASDNLVAVTDPLGRATRYAYDTRGNRTQITDALGGTTTTAYHATLNLPVAVTDPRGYTTSYEYDAYGNLTRTTDPLGHATTYTYDGCGCHVVAVTDPLGHTTQYGYDAWGNTTTITNALAAVTALTYNAAGELLAQTDANGHTTTLTYDARGRLLATTDPLNRTTRQSYDSLGNLAQVTDPLDNGLAYEYDALGRLVKVTDALGGVTAYAYDERGALTGITDANGHTTRFVYDKLGRLTEEHDPLDHAWRYEYDAAGNVTRRTDANAAVTAYTYDALNRLVLIDYPDANDVTYRYDAAGNVTYAANADVEVSQEYDALNRLTVKTVHVFDPGFTKTLRYSYDAAGNRQTMTDPDGGVTTYQYDAANQLLELVNPLNQAFTFAYDPTGQRSRKNLANGTYATYRYDAAGQLTFLGNYKSDGSVISSFAYEYDAAGNRTRKTEADGSAETYAYDAMYRLISATYSDSTFEHFSYDSVGNRLRLQNEIGTTDYSYDAADRPLAAGAVTYGWDNNGNQVSKSESGTTTAYAYDYENRLARLTFPDTKTNVYCYYPDGLRLRMTNKAGTISHVLYDEWNDLMETDTAGATATRYTSTNELDQWLSLTRQGVTEYYHQDSLGSVIGLTDDNESMLTTYKYKAFGQVQGQGAAAYNPFQFTGRRADVESGLSYYRYRYYASDLGRMMTRDWYPGELQFPLSQNRYLYAEANPVTWTDPLGLCRLSREECEKIKQRIRFIDQLIAQFEYFSRLNQRRPEGTGERQGGGLRWVGTRIWVSPSITDPTLRDAAVEHERTHRRQFWWRLHGPYYLMDQWRAALFRGGARGLDWRTLYQDEVEAYRVERDRLQGVYNRCCKDYGDDDPPSCPKGEHLEPASYQQLPNGQIVIKWKCVKDPEDEPGKQNQPPDDNFSAATSRTSASAPLLRTVPRVAVLWNGFAQEAGAFLNSIGEPYAVAGLDFLPDIAEETPVLLIPSAGLAGQESSTIFRAKLADFANRGGTIIAFTQPHGYEFAALPGGLPSPGAGGGAGGGGLGGYGYNEDISCYSNAMFTANYHPALSGLGKCSVDAHVDGYLSAWPGNATLLLARTKNMGGGLVLYPYGQGWVAVTGMYDDWGAGNGQASPDAKTLLRDLISWGMDPAGLSPTEYRPGDPVSVAVPLSNDAAVAATSVRLTLVSPARQTAGESMVSLAVPAGGTATASFSTTAAEPLGIWWVDYTLLDAAGAVIQPQAAGTRFVVSRPPAECGTQAGLSLDITAPTWTVLRDAPASFTAHVHNFGATDHEVSVTAERNHEGATIIGTVVVPAGQTMDFPFEMTFSSYSALWNGLCEPGVICTWGRTGGLLQLSHNGVDVAAPSVAVSVATERATYRAGDQVVVTATLQNLASAEYTVYANVQVYNPNHQSVYAANPPVLLPANAATPLVQRFNLPALPVFGFYTVRVEATRAGAAVGAGTARFEMPPARLYIDPVQPAAYLPGQANRVGFAIRNVGGDDVQAGALTVTLLDPSGAERWRQAATVDIAVGQTITPTFDAPFPAGLGDFKLTCLVTFGNKSAWAEVVVPAEHDVSIQPAAVKYGGGDLLTFDVGVANTGVFQEGSLTARVSAPAAGYSRVDTLALAPGQVVHVTHAVTLPLTIAGGVHPIQVELAQGEGRQQFAGSFVVLPATLELALVEEPWMAGGALRVRMTNTGGGQTTYTGTLRLRDLQGIQMGTTPVSGSLIVGAATALAAAIPATAADGLYRLTAEVTAQDTGRLFTLNRTVSVAGVKATARAASDAQVYYLTDPITATGTFTNTGPFAIAAAGVSLWLLPMAGAGPVAGVVRDLDGRPVSAAAVTLDDRPAFYSNAAGEFLFEAVMVGTHQLTVRRPGYHVRAEQAFVAGPQTPLSVYLTPAAYGEISGALRLASTQAIVVGAGITLTPVNVPAAEARTLAVRSLWDGTYRFPRAAAGVYTLAIAAAGQPPYATTLTVGEGVNLVNVWLGGAGGLRVEQEVIAPAKADTGEVH